MHDRDTLARNSLVVGDEVRRLERSIQAAMRDGAMLATSVIETLLGAPVCAAACHAAIAPVMATIAELTRAHALVATDAHPALEKIGRRLGLDESDWGGGDLKHPARQAVRGRVKSDRRSVGSPLAE